MQWIYWIITDGLLSTLFWAFVKGHEAVIGVLLGVGGIRIDQKGQVERSPLDWATLLRYGKVEDLLQAAGAEGSRRGGCSCDP